MTRVNARNASLIGLFPLLLALLMAAFNAGCGGTSPPDCSVAVALAVAPKTATADHSAAPPGNQISFVALDMPPASCPPTPGAPRLDLTWSVSDSGNVTIGNTQGVDYGVATCKNATANPATVMATGRNKLNMTITGTATLTCK